MRNFYFIITVLAAMVSSISYAQTISGIIDGKVIDKITKEPLPGVNVIVVGTNTGAATDINGEFEIKNLDLGTYQIRVSMIGFNAVIKSDIVVNSAKPYTILIEMT